MAFAPPIMALKVIVELSLDCNLFVKKGGIQGNCRMMNAASVIVLIGFCDSLASSCSLLSQHFFY